MVTLLWVWSLASALVWLAWCSLRAELAANGTRDADSPEEEDAERGPPVAFVAEKRGPRQRQRGRASAPLDKERAEALLFGRRETITSVRRWLRRLGVPLEDLPDVLQDVLKNAWSSWHTYDPTRSRPERWLNKIAVHLAAHYRDQARHHREELAAEPGDIDAADPSLDASELMELEQMRTIVRDALDELPRDLREVLIAHDIDGVPMAAIAEHQGIPLSTAYKWRARALDALADVLDRRDREEEERMEGRFAS